MSSALRSLGALSIYLLVGRPAFPETLLAEFFDERPNFHTAGMLLDMRIAGVSVGPPLEHLFQYGEAMPANGTVFVANAPTVTAIGACLVQSSCPITFITSHEGAGKVDLSPDTFWTWTNQTWFPQKISAFVPQLGPGFTGYRITSVTQTISNFSFTWEGGYYGDYHGNIAQTVRFYGIAVPEPTACMLSLLCCAAWSNSVRFRR